MNIAEISTVFELVSWREPLWLLLTFTPLMVWFFRIAFQSVKTTFADAHLMPWVVSRNDSGIWQRLFSKNSAFLTAWLFFAIAASGPRLPLEFVTQEQATDLDIMLVVDVSRSMHVTDIRPSRIRRAQIEIEELLTRAAGKRVGVIVFAARPHLLVPLTSDHQALRFYLRSLDNLTLPTSGSEPGTALDMAYKKLNNSQNPTDIVMITDGDFSTTPNSGATTANHTSPPLYILGIGSTEGEAIPLNNGEWLQYEGRPVISRLNEEKLRHLASLNRTKFTAATDGNYSPATDDDADWRALYDEGIAKLVENPKEIDDDHNIVWQELYHWPLSTALLLLLLSLIPYGFRLRYNPAVDTSQVRLPSKQKIIAPPKAIVLVITIALLNLYPQQESLAATLSIDTPVNERQAFKHFNNKNYSSALEIYKQLSGYPARLGEGACHYKMTDYISALKQFTRAVLEAKNDKDRAVALFNLGNSYFQIGNYAAALTVYEDANRYQPKHKGTLHNLEFTRDLKKAVDQRLQRSALAARMSSGPQLSPVSDSIDINPRGSLALDGRENINPKELPLPELADISNATFEALIIKGLNHIKLAAEDIPSIQSSGQQRSKLDFINAQMRMRILEDRQGLLWKQLFEIEEGFPAPLTEPRHIPGIAPW